MNTTTTNPEVDIAVDMIHDAVTVLVAQFLAEGRSKHATLAEQYAALIVATIKAGE